jgi:hypothetical protein
MQVSSSHLLEPNHIDLDLDMMMASLVHLHKVLPKGINLNGSSWRSDPKYFQPATHPGTPPGAVNISPAWFQQGKEASIYIYIWTFPIF